VTAAAIVTAIVLWAASSGAGTSGARRASTAAGRPAESPSAYAKRTIPSGYLSIYTRVASEYGLDWSVLAAIGQIESDHGRSVEGGMTHGANRAGAAGPAQFLAGTWARYGVDTRGTGRPDPYDPLNAVTAMAAYLKASGAPEDWRRALDTYNHSSAYGDAVLSLAARLRAGSR
jgi:membrane-bound lytic murein transglycosylase B